MQAPTGKKFFLLDRRRRRRRGLGIDGLGVTAIYDSLY
jgi:hypothetical protein